MYYETSVVKWAFDKLKNTFWNEFHKCLYDNKLEFGIPTLLKQSRPGKHLSKVTFSSYPDEVICIVRQVKLYLDKTSEISFHKPHRAVSTNTISRWIKTVLSDSGVDISVYKPHSTWAASTSAAHANGLPIDSILEKVGWSKESTFARFYHRDIDSQCLNDFVQAH